MRNEIFKLVGGSAFVFACRLTGALLVLLTQILLARWMGAKELGIYVFALSWCMLLATVTGLGYPEAGLRFIGRSLAHKDLGSIRGFIRRGRQINAVFSLVIVLLSAILIMSLRGMMPVSYVVPLLVTTACIPVFTMIRLHQIVAHAMSWFVLAFLPSMVLRPLLFILAIYAIWHAGFLLTAERAMLLQLTVMALVAIGQFVILSWWLNRKLQTAQPSYDTRLWLHTAAPLLMITLFTQYFAEIGVILVGMMLPSEDVAIYNASYRIALVIAFGIAAVNAATTPRISRLFAEGNRVDMQRLVAQATQLRFWSSLCAILILVQFGEDILALFGDDFVVGYESLLILGLTQLVRAAVGPVDVLLSITGNQNRCLKIFVVALVVFVALNLLFVPRFGINGAAMAVFLVVVFWTLCLHTLVVRHLEIQPSVLSFAKAIHNSSR